MHILVVARDARRWRDSPTSEDQALALGFEHHGVQVTRTTAASRKPPVGRFNYVFCCKMLQFPRWFDEIAPTAMFYGDYRTPDHDQWLSHDHVQYKFTQFDDGRGIWCPPPTWCDDFKVTRQRPGLWLWTGRSPTMGDRLRCLDIQALPEETPMYGWTADWPALLGTKYVNAIETHQFGLVVSSFHDVLRYTSDRTADYQAGGITCAVRRFPGVEELTAPGSFIYDDTDELREFVKDPISMDPREIHAFARTVFDGRVIAGRILEHLR